MSKHKDILLVTCDYCGEYLHNAEEERTGTHKECELEPEPTHEEKCRERNR